MVVHSKDGIRARIMEAARGDDIEHSETSPLLSPTTTEDHNRNSISRHTLFRTPNAILLVMLAVVVLTSFGDQLGEVPLNRIYESVLCYKHYETNDPSKIKLPRSALGPGAIGGVDELWCKKADEVQNDLAMLNGLLLFLNGIPGLLLAVPFGWAADRYGRWPFIMLNLFQIAAKVVWSQFVAWQWQIFDVRVMWAQSLFCLLGGGSPVISALFFVAIQDVVPEKDRASAFLRLGAANLSASLLMPPLAALLMRKSPWIPSIMGTVMFILAMLLYLLVPETLHYGKAEADSNQAESNLAGSTPGPPDLAPSNPPISANVIVVYSEKFKATMAFLTRDYRVPLLILPFVAHILIAEIASLLLQYVSKRYSLTFSAATILITIRNGVTVLLLVVILPYLSTLAMTRFGLSSQRKDLYLARISQIFVAVGWLALAASTNIPVAGISLAISSLGQGAALLMRSFLSTIVPANEIARTYSVIAIVDTLGIMFGSPLLALLFEKGIGLPFVALGLSSALFAVLLFIVKVRKGEDEIVSDISS
ncbi:hypothetical protein CKM354_000413400 [Cercospora kikuchii]|uniref:Major facilitator superfamily (MFS) profile domain-containing protein n=1 Tax=Cercospora kikuchii TaxID=84275 RepID=A0A9P3CJ99_9PEZI|nr:uncharacterized protein CKM354_000413400 [Cercospora kikuchii]GIZ40810.1 hypothetical protein CKM354_000413400 [Cercospora kikuchii]